MCYRAADLILVRGNTIIDKLIEDVSHSEYSHCAGIVKPNELVESQFGRTTGYEPLDAYAGEYDVYTCDTLTDDQRNAIVKFVLNKIGTPYNAALVGWEFVFYAFHINLPMHEGNCYDCSELWRQAYKSVGVDLCPNVEYASPSDLALSSLLRKL